MGPASRIVLSCFALPHNIRCSRACARFRVYITRSNKNKGASIHKPIDAREEPHRQGVTGRGSNEYDQMRNLGWLADDTPGKFLGEGGRWSRRHAVDHRRPGADHGGNTRGTRPNPPEARKFVPNVGRRGTGEGTLMKPITQIVEMPPRRPHEGHRTASRRRCEIWG